MQPNPSLVVAPWVVPVDADHSHYLLGPRMQLLQLPDGPIGELDANDQAELAALDFVCPPRPAASHDRPASAAALDTHGGLVVSEEFPAEARALAEQLDAADPERSWSHWEQLPAGLDAHHVVIHIDAREPGRAAQTLADRPTAAARLWLGECAEGLHVGPLIRSADDARRYDHATRNWSGVGALEQLGFGDQWPLSVVPRLRRDPAPVAAAIVEALRATPGDCVLVDSRRVVTPWTALDQRPVEPTRLRDSQAWSKGMLRDLVVEESADFPGLFFGACQSPCDRDVALEPRFGKGMTPAEAEATTVGEAVERFSSWRAGQRPAVALDATEARYALRDFHPFGPPWREHQRRGEPPVPYTLASDAITGRPVAVPHCLVPEPYEPPPGQPLCTAATTSGLAAYSTRTGAIVRGAMELLERNNFYPAFVHQRPPTRLPIEHLPAGPGRDQLAARARTLAERGLDLHLMMYPDDLQLPIVHSMLWDRNHRAMARGAGSALDITSAAIKAAVEAVQINQQHQFVRQSGLTDGANAAYVQWSTDAVTDALFAYLHTQQAPAELPAPFEDEAALLAHLGRRLRAHGRPLLAAELPCPVAGWTAVRVLIPGITCHGYASHSAGGSRLLHPRFCHAIPI